MKANGVSNEAKARNLLANKTIDYLPNLWQGSVKTVSEQIKKLSKQFRSEKNQNNGGSND